MINALSAILLRAKKDLRGVTALEYGLIASLIAVAIITGVTAVGTNAEATFTNIANHL